MCGRARLCPVMTSQFCQVQTHACPRVQELTPSGPQPPVASTRPRAPRAAAAPPAASPAEAPAAAAAGAEDAGGAGPATPVAVRRRAPELADRTSPNARATAAGLDQARAARPEALTAGRHVRLCILSRIAHMCCCSVDVKRVCV